MSDENIRSISAFSFEDEEAYKKALKELEGIKYIKERLSLDDPKRVISIYNKIIEDKMFETPVGLSFMYELGEILMSAGVDQKGLMTFDVKTCAVRKEGEKDSVGELKGKLKETRGKLVKTRRRFALSFIVMLILAAAIVAMMIISSQGETVTVLNYRNKIINEYEQWEQELEEREQKIEEFENAHGLNS